MVTIYTSPSCASCRKVKKWFIEQNIPFKVLVVGKGRLKEGKITKKFACFKEVEFLGYKENPFPYMKNADYLVQLSDDESWCNSITEAKSVGTPIIVTNFESAKEQVIDDYIKGKDIGIKIVMLKEFSKDLGTILEKYK